MARRKVVFVIVEGASDETALGIALNQVFDKESVHVHIMHGDITTRTGVTPQNIVAKIGNEVRTYATSNHYKPSDFKQIRKRRIHRGREMPKINLRSYECELDHVPTNRG